MFNSCSRASAKISADARDFATRRPSRGRVQAVEALGPEQLVHVEIDAKPVLVEDVLEGLVDMEEAGDLAEIRPDTDGSRATVVARLDASARVRPDEPIELAVDLRHLHFFDLGSGEAIGA